MKYQSLVSVCKTMFLCFAIAALFSACAKYNTPFPESTSKPATILTDKDFNDSSLTSGGWKEYSVTGAEKWTTSMTGSTDYYVKMSGYVSPSNFANEDWLISPSYNSNTFNQITLTFETAKNYTGNDLEVFVSINYDGISSPSTATWTKLTVALSTGSWVWTLSGNIDISAYKGAATYVAFKFTSTTVGSATWEVDDIIITGK